MTFRQFWKLIEPHSKILSILPTIMGISYAAVYFGQVNWLNSLIFFAGALLFDMTTSAINNIMDYHKGTTDEYVETSNLVGRHGMNPKITEIVVISMLILSTVIGIILVIRTGWLLLLMGMFCFGVGVFYTYGPLPLSRLPFGEFFAGFTMGFLIPLIAIFVNVDQSQLLEMTINQGYLSFHFQIINSLAVILVCVLPTATIAGVELANNLSDYDEDLINDRKTLAMYISRSAALNLFKLLVFIGYGTTILAVVLRFLPWPTLILFATLPRVIKLTKIFLAEQKKHKTFIFSIYITMYEIGFICIGLLISWIFGIK